MAAVSLDKYARDVRAWRSGARAAHAAAVTLFLNQNPIVWLAAATLAHHAVEMYLKAALVSAGMTVFNPRHIDSLNKNERIRASECVWGHGLVDLGKRLAGRRREFDLSAVMDVRGYWFFKIPMTIEQGLELFDPFFSELRYPQELKQSQGIGEHEKIVLDALFRTIEPFIEVPSVIPSVQEKDEQAP